MLILVFVAMILIKNPDMKMCVAGE